MVFPRFVAQQEDPELIAERELAELEGTNSTVPATVLRAKEASRAKQAAAVAASKTGRDSVNGEEHRPMDRSSHSSISNSSASLDTVASSTACNTTGAKAPKEAKADRKRRTRGVSGCSIKKDGGRFDMGFEDLEDVDYEDYDEDDFYGKDLYGDEEYEPAPEPIQGQLKSSEKKDPSDSADSTSEQWLDAIQTVIVDQPDYYFPLFGRLLKEEKCELSVIRRLAKEIQRFYNTRLETVLVGDVFSEYKIMELVRRLLEEDAIKKYSISAYLDMAVMKPHEYIDHVQELFAWTMMEIDRFNHDGKVDLYKEIPKEAKTLAAELVTENSVGEIAHLIQDILPCFHASFVFECFSQGILTMSMSKIYYCVQATSELYDACIISKESILIGLHRLVREVPELEKDLPCAKSMVHLVFSYATTMLPVTEEDKEDLEPPQHMLYADLSNGGHLEVCEPPKDMGPLSSQTFLMLDGDWPAPAEKAYVSPPLSEDEYGS